MNAAIQHLTDADPVLGALIARVGPCSLRADRRRTPFQALVQAVAHQQLNGKAANTILKRFTALFPHDRFPSPKEVQGMDPARITSAGFSRAKAGYIQGIAAAARQGLVPGRAETERMTDEDIIQRLTRIKGVGLWSVEMFLIFGLGRPDVLPVHDFGVRYGFELTYRKRKPPKPEVILKFGERWRPYRSTAAWYLWRAVDLARAKPA